MLGHVSLGVRDLDASARFYDAVLGALGFARTWSADTSLGYGPPGFEKLNLFAKPDVDERLAAGPGFHLAFDAPNRTSVDAFHAAAVAHGGTSVGLPGLRRHYSATYYATFVLDPDGHKLEAVHQQR